MVLPSCLRILTLAINIIHGVGFRVHRGKGLRYAPFCGQPRGAAAWTVPLSRPSRSSSSRMRRWCRCSGLFPSIDRQPQFECAARCSYVFSPLDKTFLFLTRLGLSVYCRRCLSYIHSTLSEHGMSKPRIAGILLGVGHERFRVRLGVSQGRTAARSLGIGG